MPASFQFYPIFQPVTCTFLLFYPLNRNIFYEYFNVLGADILHPTEFYQ
jgi:hypothetical protein